MARGSRGARARTPVERGRRDHIGVRRLLGWAAFLPMASRAPMYGRLLLSLMTDERMPRPRKALLAAALGYLAIGRDLVPDDVPVIGGLDDLVVMVLAVDLFLDGVPPEVLDEKLVELGIDRRAFAQDVSRIRRFMPGTIRRLVRRIPGALGLAGDTLQYTRLGSRVRAWINKEGSIA